MIELRWTWKHQCEGIIASEVKAGEKPTLYPVLQYRENFDPVSGIVSNWIDVPLPPKPED